MADFGSCDFKLVCVVEKWLCDEGPLEEETLIDVIEQKCSIEEDMAYSIMDVITDCLKEMPIGQYFIVANGTSFWERVATMDGTDIDTWEHIDEIKVRKLTRSKLEKE